MARRFDSRNTVPPLAVLNLVGAMPKCWTDRRDWFLYLIESHRAALADEGDRARMNRGELPNFCAECEVKHQKAMQAKGRCASPYPESTPAARMAGATSRDDERAPTTAIT